MVDEDAQLRKFQKELSAGTVSLALLAVLARAGEPLYGYLIAKELERVGEGVLSGKQSALYPVLRNLEGAGLLESHVEPSSSGPPRRYYRINERGLEVLAQWRRAWQATRDSVDSVLEGDTAMNEPNLAGAGLPTTIAQYLAQLRAALHGADPAMVQDALYDAEEYLRSELAAQPGRSEADVIADVAGSYGAPDEVAEIYRETEITVNRALRTPRADTRPVLRAAAEASGATPVAAPVVPVERSLAARFFGVVMDPHTYGALFYMLLSLATGTFFFTWVVTGLSLSLGLLILIIGVPLTVLFFGSVRGLALLEGRLVEALLGERMPRRPQYTDRSRTWLQRIGDMFTDGRTWLTLLYFMLMLPLGIVYFTIAVTLLSVSLAFIWSPVAALFDSTVPSIYIDGTNVLPVAATPLLALVGALLLLLTMHLARGIGKLHGLLAKHLLVRL